MPTPTVARHGMSETTIESTIREAMVEVAGEGPLEAEDRHLVHLEIER